MLFNEYRITSPFGARTLANGDTRFHNGIDVVAVGDTTVLSPVAGKVIMSRIVTDKSNSTWEWGNYICILSADGFTHYFCHLNKRLVSVNTIVKANARLGIMGNTGYSYGAHLHYGVKNRIDKWIDPIDYLNILTKGGAFKNSSNTSNELFTPPDTNGALFTAPTTNGSLFTQPRLNEPDSILKALLGKDASNAIMSGVFGNNDLLSVFMGKKKK